MKIHELAKELDISSKELVEKVQSMGIEAKSHMTNLSDLDVLTVKNAAQKSKEGAETKIVKVAAKKSQKKEEKGEPKVVVKAAKISIPKKRTKPQAPRPQETTATPKPPIGKPVVPQNVESRTKMPIGKPMGKPVVSKEVEERESKKPQGKIAAKPMPKKDVPIDETSKKEAPAKEPSKKETPAKETTKKETPTKEASQKKGEEQTAASEQKGTRPARSQKLTILRKASDIKAEEEKKAAEKKAAAEAAAKSGDRPTQKREDHSTQRREGRPLQKAAGRPMKKGEGKVSPGSGARPSQSREGRPSQSGEGRSPRRDESRPSGRGEDRPTRRSDDRPPRKDQSGRPAKSAGTSETITRKPSGRKSSKGKEKERDKFAKIERGGKRGKPQAPRSLEKKVRKKPSKPKAAPVPEVEEVVLPVGTKVINVPITVAGLAEQIQITVSQVIMTLMKLGVMATVNQNIDEDMVLLLADELGINIVIGKIAEEVVEEGLETHKDEEKDLVTRPPIITVMGHVDHGKTSLLDAIRKTNVIASESGGITQHIGASEVEVNGQKIVFLDTPGHEAFTAMRARGAHTTDIAVLVVAADDSVKPQTIESISHAKAAAVPIIVAINKMDKPGANPDTVKKDLADNGVLVEDWGGEVIAAPVSAKSGDGIVNLLEMILLQAEVLELRANPDRLAIGTVLEGRLDKAKGPVASLLVMNGTLHAGDSIVAGTCSGKIRRMTNFKGDTIKKAGPATAVEILGLTEVPYAGDQFNAVKEDRTAREIAEQRHLKQRGEVLARNASTTLEELFSQIQEGEVKELNLIIKGDVQGSVGAIVTSLEKLSNENVRVKIVHTGVGAISESDVMLAGTSDAIIIGFNVRPNAASITMADKDAIQIRTYRVIYDIIDDIENAMKGMLDPEFKEVLLGTVEIRETFKVPNAGIIGGSYVTDGKVIRNGEVRLVRDGIVIHEGKISSLRRFKDDAKEVAQGFECGIGIENYNDIKVGDIIECFQMEEIKRD